MPPVGRAKIYIKQLEKTDFRAAAAIEVADDAVLLPVTIILWWKEDNCLKLNKALELMRKLKIERVINQADLELR